MHIVKLALLVFSLVPAIASAGCFRDSLATNSNGEILITLGGSIYETLPGDSFTALLWLPTSSLMICDTQLSINGKTYPYIQIINTDNKERISATQIGGTSQTKGQSSKNSYTIEVSHNDELFIINGEKFEAKTYCFNMRKGDRVIFLKGSAFGACASAEILNLRTEKICRVWCE